MPISNVQQNKIDAIKLNFSNQAKKATANKPEYLKMTGSIFNAPGVQNTPTATATSLSNMNTLKSLSEFNTANQPAATNSGSQTTSEANITDIDNVADGKAAAASAEASADQVESLTQDTQNDQKTVDKYNTDAQKLNKQIKKDDQKFQTQLKKQEAEFKKDNDKLLKLVQETEEAQTEIDNAQNELDSLMSSSSFSINRSSTNGAQTNPNQSRINALQTLIGSKTTLVQSNGTKIYSLQRSSTRTLKQMQKTNNNYVKVNQKNTKAIETNQSDTNKVIKTATQIEQISAIVTQTGQLVNVAGKGLVALGTAMSGLFGAGAALIATGNVMQKVGTVVEMVGNYGQAAANITKTAAYAADGNLAGALTSAVSAAQTGTAAVKSTKELGNTFNTIDEQANQATQKLAANTAAKEQASQLAKNGQLGGMTEKEMKKSISSQLQAEMANDKTGNISKDLINDIKNNQIGQNNKVSNAANQAKTAFSSAVDGEGGTITDGIVTGLDNKARKTVGNKTVSKFQNVAAKTVKSSQKFDWGKLENGLQSTAALFTSQNTAPQYTGQTKGYVPQWDLSQDSRFQKIRKARISNLSHASYV